MEATYGVDLPDCFFVDAEYDQKYVLMRGPKKNAWLVVSRKRSFHSDIVRDFEEESYEPRSVTVHGGGILVKRDGRLRCFGSSGGFGPVRELDVVRRCLETTQLPVDRVEATDYVRE